MNQAIAWAGFLGAWLLVAGPLYQGAIELDEADVDREAIEAGYRTHRWPAWLFWPLIIVMLGVSVLNTAVRMSQGERTTGSGSQRTEEDASA